jgi:carbonic anhydrase/acetyltransferase-like protein (isoleucine patch superfamily)
VVTLAAALGRLAAVPRRHTGCVAIYSLGDKRPRIHPSAWVHPEATLTGDVWVDERASIWPGVVIRADNSPIRIGARSSVQDGAVLHTQPQNATTVGPDCVIGHLAHLEGCLLESAVLAGTGSVVLERVVARHGSLIGAGAVVIAGTEIPSGAIAVGVPAKIKLNAVPLDRILGNVGNYLDHLDEHLEGMAVVSLDDCLDEDPLR